MAKKKKVTRLTQEQKDYIEGNYRTLEDLKIARSLKVPVKLVREHLELLESQKSEFSPRNEIITPDGRGAVMTESVSMAIDDGFSNEITQDMINRAASMGDYEKAAELVRMKREQTVSREAHRRINDSHYVHYISKG